MTNQASGIYGGAVRDIDYIGERGLGPWIKSRREKKGMTAVELAQAATIGSRTVNRYEKDEGLGYETLRVLDSLGVRWNARPLKDSPAAVNRELREVRLAVEALAAGVPVEARLEIADRLQSLEDRVDAFAGATAESLDRIAGAIARLDARLDAEGGQSRARGDRC